MGKTGTSWLYSLKKEELIDEAANRQLDTSGGVDELRKRLSDFIKTNEFGEASGNTNAETKVVDPPPQLVPLADDIFRQRMAEHQLQNPRPPPHNPVPHHEPTDAEVLEIVRKWNVHFDGGNDAFEFLERFEELATLYNVPFDRLTRNPPDKLRSRALEWFRNNRDTFLSWQNFKDEFQNYFLSRRHRMKLEDDIRRRTQGNREKGKDFVTSMQTLYRRIGQIPVVDQIERIYENLRTEYRLYIRRQDFRTLSELIVFIEQYEEIMREQTRHTSHGIDDGPSFSRSTQKIQRPTTPPPPSATTSSNPFKLPPWNRETDCWRCGQRGHTRHRCRNAYIPLCSLCGRQGNPRQCPCLSENEQRGPSVLNA